VESANNKGGKAAEAFIHLSLFITMTFQPACDPLQTQRMNHNNQLHPQIDTLADNDLAIIVGGDNPGMGPYGPGPSSPSAGTPLCLPTHFAGYFACRLLHKQK
jgi:hypothetical protein